jgi:hypothetical protein
MPSVSGLLTFPSLILAVFFSTAHTARYWQKPCRFCTAIVSDTTITCEIPGCSLRRV